MLYKIGSMEAIAMKIRMGLLKIMFVSLVLLSPATTLHAQREIRIVIDSLKAGLNAGKQDTQSVKLLCDLAYNYRNINPDTGLLFGHEAFALATTVHWKKGIAMSFSQIGLNYMVKAAYPKALDTFLIALKMYKELGYRPGIGWLHGLIATIFQYEHNYEKSIAYNRQALTIYQEDKDDNGIAHRLGDIGIDFCLMKRFDSALLYTHWALGIYERQNMPAEIARTCLNLGWVYADSGNNGKALEYYFEALRRMRPANNRRIICNCYINIGDVYKNMVASEAPTMSSGERSHLLHLAETYIDSALVIEEEVGIPDYRAEANKILCAIAELQKDYRHTYEYYKAYIEIEDSIFSTNNKIKVAEAEARYLLDLKQKQIELNKLELDKTKNERWFFVCGVVLLALLGALVINKQVLKEKKLEGEKKSAEAELDAASKMLENFRISIQEKNAIIEQVTEQLGQMSGGRILSADEETLERLQNSMLLTDQQWEDFTVIFEKVHRGFFARVKQKMPDLTPAELRFVTLSKLKLSPKEMANMLGISSNSIRNYRHRLRKKLNLGDQASIEDIASAI